MANACRIVSARAAFAATNMVMPPKDGEDTLDAIAAREKAEDAEIQASLNYLVAQNNARPDDADDTFDDEQPRAKRLKREEEVSHEVEYGLAMIHSGVSLVIDDGRRLTGTAPQLGPFKFTLKPIIDKTDKAATMAMPLIDQVRRTLIKQLLKRPTSTANMYNDLWTQMMRPANDTADTALFERGSYRAPNGNVYPAWYQAVPNVYTGLINDIYYSRYLTPPMDTYEVTCNNMCPHLLAALAQHVFRFNGDMARRLFASTTFKSRPITKQDVAKHRASMLKEFFPEEASFTIEGKHFYAHIVDLPNTVLLYLARIAASTAAVNGMPFFTSVENDENTGELFLSRLRSKTHLKRWSQAVFACDEYDQLASEVFADYYAKELMNKPRGADNLSDAHYLQRQVHGLFEHACFVVFLLDCMQLELYVPYKTIECQATGVIPQRKVKVGQSDCTIAITNFDEEYKSIHFNPHIIVRCLLQEYQDIRQQAHLAGKLISHPYYYCVEHGLENLDFIEGVDDYLATVPSLVATSDYGLANDALQRNMVVTNGDMSTVDRRITKLYKQHAVVNRMAREYYGLHVSTAPNFSRISLLYTPEYREPNMRFELAYSRVFGNGDISIITKLEAEMKASLHELIKLVSSDKMWMSPEEAFPNDAKKADFEASYRARNSKEHMGRLTEFKMKDRTTTQKSLDYTHALVQDINQFAVPVVNGESTLKGEDLEPSKVLKVYDPKKKQKKKPTVSKKKMAEKAHPPIANFFVAKPKTTPGASNIVK